MNLSGIIKVDQVLQFILATASQEDPGNRELGPIHLIKYLYLADLDHAKHFNGMTYTTLEWVFYHFGPWNTEAFIRTEPALQAVAAEKRVIELEAPRYESEFVRWSMDNDGLYNQLEKDLPFVVTASIQKYVHQFQAETEDLLHFVYTTWPMLRAKPGNKLDFSIPEFFYEEKQEPGHEANQSARQKKKKRQAIKDLKREFKEKLEAKKRASKPPAPPPISLYDDIYFEGLKTLDELAGESIESAQGIVEFSDDIWESRSRFDPDVP